MEFESNGISHQKKTRIRTCNRINNNVQRTFNDNETKFKRTRNELKNNSNQQNPLLQVENKSYGATTNGVTNKSRDCNKINKRNLSTSESSNLSQQQVG